MNSSEAAMIMGELKTIKEDLAYIKSHMVDVDSILTPEEAERIEEGLAEYKAGKAVPIEEFEAQMEGKDA